MPASGPQRQRTAPGPGAAVEVTVGQVRDRLGISFPPASELVRRFVEADILVEVTGRDRYRIYQYTPYIHLFSDPQRRPIPA